MDGRPYGHMNTTDVAKLASASNAKSPVLTHLPHFGEVEKMAGEVKAAGYAGDIALAKAGLTIAL